MIFSPHYVFGMNQVKRGLGELFKRDRDDTNMTWVLNGPTKTLDAMRRAIERAENLLLAALWESESTEFAPSLLAAHSRGVEVHLGCYGIPRKASPTATTSLRRQR
jgi:sugar-specific transcriptional regulator TrmB